jgi:hypothetical protein
MVVSLWLIVVGVVLAVVAIVAWISVRSGTKERRHVPLSLSAPALRFPPRFHPSRTKTWFYIWGSPLMWALPTAMAWMALHADIGSGEMMLAIVWPVMRLSYLLSPTLTSTLLGPVILGTVVMGITGLLQDLLDVPRSIWLVVAYLIALLVPVSVILVFFGFLASVSSISWNAGSAILWGCGCWAHRLLFQISYFYSALVLWWYICW